MTTPSKTAQPVTLEDVAKATPRTDVVEIANLGKTWQVSFSRAIELARTLERELAVWRKMAHDLDAKCINEQRDHVKTCDYHDATKAKLAVVEKERDELKEDQEYRQREMGAVWENVQAISPWNPSNDMNWSDEISCGLLYLEEQLAAATAKADAAAARVKGLVEAINEALMHLNTNYCIDGLPMKDSDAANALNAALTTPDTVNLPMAR